VILKPCGQPGDLVDGGDITAGDLLYFQIDLRGGLLGNPARSFSKGTINTETACVFLLLISHVACSVGGKEGSRQ